MVLFLITLVSAIITEPKNPTLEITTKTELTIKTETSPILVQLKPVGDLKNNLIINQEEFELNQNSQKTVNLELKTPLRQTERLFMNVLYKNPSDDKVPGDNSIILEVKSTDNKQLFLTIKEDIPTAESDVIQMGFSIIPLLVIGVIGLLILRKNGKK